MKTLGVVVPYWNPFSDPNRLGNLRRCLERLRAAGDAWVVCVEMVVEGRSGLADVVVQGAPESVFIWQKERLLNHGFERLAANGVDCLGYVDADCFFTSDDWSRRILDRFDEGYDFVQGFSRAVNGNNSVPAALASFPGLSDRLHGGSVFLHRDLYQRIGGLYEHCIVGGGDFALMMAVTGVLGTIDRIFPGKSYRAHFEKWLSGFHDAEIRPACAANDINILQHGNPNRSYRLRHALLKDFVPEEDIIRGDALGFSETGMRLLPRLRAYCAHRENRPDMIVREKS